MELETFEEKRLDYKREVFCSFPGVVVQILERATPPRMLPRDLSSHLKEGRRNLC